eukprot:gene4654-biopygen16040
MLFTRNSSVLPAHRASNHHRSVCLSVPFRHVVRVLVRAEGRVGDVEVEREAVLPGVHGVRYPLHCAVLLCLLGVQHNL